MLTQVLENDDRCHIEVCPAAGQIVQEVSKRIQQHGGFALFADYGHSGEKGDTFRVSTVHRENIPYLHMHSCAIDFLREYFKDWNKKELLPVV